LPGDDETLLIVGRDKVGGAREKGTETRDDAAASLLAEAQARGWRLEMNASLQNLKQLHAWLVECPGLGGLPVEEARLVESALYEVCANIVEHGCGMDRKQTLDLWWVASSRGICHRRGAER